MKAGNVISATDSDGVSIADTMTEKLTALSSDMDTYINILSSFKGIMDSAQSIISTTKIMLPSLDTVLDSSKTSQVCRQWLTVPPTQLTLYLI